ncbi:hypothetical protein TNIN_73211 [Trichonephila inaurata madagascariensis]|uniref:Uncharacterized protein n=1 Tax=Trichonephila inaurata madagascariensis TaxID=2747483 RepID=A0A8X6YU81_9ARAC|nr:hypothetical protein TNIN_73211 [Trichonephila inaurata madagascariensis]
MKCCRIFYSYFSENWVAIRPGLPEGVHTKDFSSTNWPVMDHPSTFWARNEEDDFPILPGVDVDDISSLNFPIIEQQPSPSSAGNVEGDITDTLPSSLKALVIDFSAYILKLMGLPVASNSQNEEERNGEENGCSTMDGTVASTFGEQFKNKEKFTSKDENVSLINEECYKLAEKFDFDSTEETDIVNENVLNTSTVQPSCSSHDNTFSAPMSTDSASSSRQLTQPPEEDDEVQYLYSKPAPLPNQYVGSDPFERVYVFNPPLLSDQPSSSRAPTGASNDDNEVQFVCNKPGPIPTQHSICNPHIIRRFFWLNPSENPPTDGPRTSLAPIEPLNEDDDDVVFLGCKINSTNSESSQHLPHLYSATNEVSSFRTPLGTPGPECCLVHSLRPVEPPLPIREARENLMRDDMDVHTVASHEVYFPVGDVNVPTSTSQENESFDRAFEEKQHNARSHTAQVAEDFLLHVQSHPQPIRFWTYNSIEHFWYQLKHQMQSRQSAHDL